jgi:hypothetical protein
MSEPASEQDRPNEGESSRDSSEHGQSHRGHRHRRRRRHKKEKPTSKAAIAAFVGLILVLGAAGYFVIGPRVIRKLKATIQQTELPGNVVHLNWSSVTIMNLSSNDWGYTTVTVNDKYEAHCPDIPKGTEFEIRLKDFRGPDGPFEPTAPTVRKVTVQPDGKPPIVWDRPME